MYRVQLAAFATITAVSLFVGCGARSGVNDDALASDIKAKLYSDATTKAANINVAVKDGVVTLSGDVPSSDVELQAMKVANATAGVKTVTDQLTVNGAAAGNQAPSPGTAPAPVSANSPYTSQPPPHTAENPPTAQIPASSTTRSATRERIAPAVVTIPAGERVSVRMVDSIDSTHNSAGQVFRASLDAPLVAGDRVVIPAGENASVLLTESRAAGRIKGSSALEVRLASVSYHGRDYQVDSSSVAEAGKARGKQTVVRTGIGAAAGAVIGALAGGGKGAAIGSAAGGGAGLGYDLLTHGQAVKIPSETVLTFRLQSPLSIQERR